MSFDDMKTGLRGDQVLKQGYEMLHFYEMSIDLFTRCRVYELSLRNVILRDVQVTR